MKNEETKQETTIEVKGSFVDRAAAAAHAERVMPGFKVINEEVKPAAGRTNRVDVK